MKKSIIDVADELLIVPSNGGIKLLNPSNVAHSENSNADYYSIAKMFALPINIIFLNHNSIIQNINETTIETCGYPSAKKTIGKSVKLAAKKEAAEELMKQDRTVLKNMRMTIKEVNFTRNIDDFSFPSLAFKFPWYGNDNKLLGIFGCSIVMGPAMVASLAESMSLLMQAKLLGVPSVNTPNRILPGKIFYGIYLSERETQCVNLLVKGKTAKMIAQRLGLSYRTVEHYLENIKMKLSVDSRAELIDKATAYLEL